VSAPTAATLFGSATKLPAFGPVKAAFVTVAGVKSRAWPLDAPGAGELAGHGLEPHLARGDAALLVGLAEAVAVVLVHHPKVRIREVLPVRESEVADVARGVLARGRSGTARSLPSAFFTVSGWKLSSIF
jgi:hypothetical protein